MKGKNIYILILTVFSVVSLFFDKVTFSSERKEYYATKQEVQDFIKEWVKLAQEDMKTSGIYASLTIAQAANESGWGVNNLPKIYHNYYGMKRGVDTNDCLKKNEKVQDDDNGVWKGQSVCLYASEGVYQYFRTYDNAKQSLQDRNRNFWCNSEDRYDDVVHATTVKEQLDALARSGYRLGDRVFDGVYYNRIADIINDYDLTQYDEGITFVGGKPSYASDCSTTGGTSFTGKKEGFIDLVDESSYNYANLNTSYTGDYTQGYIYQKYHEDEMWNIWGTDSDEEIVNIIIGNVFLQGEKLYGDGVLHLDNPVTDGSDQTGPGSAIGSGIFSGYPLPEPLICTSGFGNRERPKPGASKYHEALDFSAPRGTNVFAIGEGNVITAGELGSCGLAVEINHGSGMKTRYCHLDQINVTVGQKVVAGNIIGLSGNTGVSTGPHLHFGVYINGKARDPREVIPNLKDIKCRK